MQNPMDQFLEAMRGLEKARTPLDGEIPLSTRDTVLDSSEQMEFDPNRREVEEDGIRQEGLRRLKVRRQSKGHRGQTKT